MSQPQSGLGLACAIGAYGLWGLVALYFKTVDHVTPPEVLAYRAFWSFVVLAIVTSLLGQWSELWQALRNRRTAAMLALSTVLIAINWLTYIHAVATRQLLEASLGYFINPLVNVALGVVILGERLRAYQRLSIALAAAGVAAHVFMVGTVPWLALVLAVTFGLYGLMRKTMPVSGPVGLTAETLVLTPLAAAYLAWLWQSHATTATGAATQGLLALSGLVTTVPLLLFVAAARRLRLSTLGIVQFLSPSLQFLLAVVAFREPFSVSQLLSFGCIWTAIGIYAVDSVRASRQRAYELVEPD